ncbi:MAG: hypothetical protein WED15_05680 [Akkermansiaceae bacterium]
MSGLTIMALGVAATFILEREAALGFLNQALTWGGAIVICGIFSIKMKWHGIIGAGILALLGASRGVLNLPDFFRLMQGDRARGTAPLLELGVTLISLLLLLRVLRALRRERTRRMLETEE